MSALPGWINPNTVPSVVDVCKALVEHRLSDASQVIDETRLIPHEPAALAYLEALLACQSGQPEKAFSVCRTEWRRGQSYPEFCQLLMELAMVQGEAPWVAMAAQHWWQLDPSALSPYLSLAQWYTTQEQWEDVVRVVNQALANQCEVPVLQVLRAQAYKRQGKLTEAIQDYAAAIALDPHQPDWLVALGNLFQLLDTRQAAVETQDGLTSDYLEEAILYYQAALALNPADGDAHYNMGNAFLKLEKIELAEASYRECLRHEPNHVFALNNLGIVLRTQCRLEEAIAAYQRGAELNPDYGNVRYNLAVCRLLQGNFQGAWQDYETRNQKNDYLRFFPQPLWNGQPFEGKRLLIWAEGGYGDTFQFIRYLKRVKQLGGDVTLVVQSGLEQLLSGLEGVDTLLVRPYEGFEDFCRQVVKTHTFDYVVGLMSLPPLLRIDLVDIPTPMPYLSANPDRARFWKSRLENMAPQGALKVGICWTGSRTVPSVLRRSCPFDVFQALFDIPNVQCFSLQKWQALSERFDIQKMGLNVVDLSPDLVSFDETAAVVENLDLVISIDTGIVHLAGAMNKPVWLMLPFSPDWRWMLEREETPWYPSVRLVRQPSLGDWESVMARICQDLGWLSTSVDALSG